MTEQNQPSEQKAKDTTPQEITSKTQHSITIDGVKLDYTVVAGTILLKEENVESGEVAKASIFYIAYTLDGVENPADRPVTFSFNGGPGSSSVWMHLGLLGPKRVLFDDDGLPLPPPYKLIDNEFTLLTHTDLVFIDPVSTGYSRTVPKEKPGQFHSLKKDVESVGEFIRLWTTRNNRWLSAKFLIGESYGTPRVSGLSLELQNSHWMYLNGVILVSPTGLGIERGTAVEAANDVPYYAAAAWFHKKLPSDLQSKDLMDVLAEVEAYTVNKLIPVMAKGGFLSEAEKRKTAGELSRYLGLSEKVIMEHDLRVPKTFFWKDLLRDEGFTIGRLDSRYLGIDKMNAGERPDYSPEMKSWEHSFTPAINYYFKNYLNYNTDLKYFIGGQARPWDRSNNHTGEDLRQAMAQNPYLHVMVQSGYYDGATDYFNSKYNLWQMDTSGKLKERMSWKGYRSGHMMYLRSEDLITSNEHIREFIQKSLPKEDQSAQYIRD